MLSAKAKGFSATKGIHPAGGKNVATNRLHPSPRASARIDVSSLLEEIDLVQYRKDGQERLGRVLKVRGVKIVKDAILPASNHTYNLETALNNKEPLCSQVLDSGDVVLEPFKKDEEVTAFKAFDSGVLIL